MDGEKIMNTLGRHPHPMPNAAYVISGTLNLESKESSHHATPHAGGVLSWDGRDGASRLDRRCPS